MNRAARKNLFSIIGIILSIVLVVQAVWMFIVFLLGGEYIPLRPPFNYTRYESLIFDSWLLGIPVFLMVAFFIILTLFVMKKERKGRVTRPTLCITLNVAAITIFCLLTILVSGFITIGYFTSAPTVHNVIVIIAWIHILPFSIGLIRVIRERHYDGESIVFLVLVVIVSLVVWLITPFPLISSLV